jgi:hypothetical protein
MAYPISRGRLINFVAFEVNPDEEGTHFGGASITNAEPRHLATLFRGWEREVGELIQVRAGRGEGRPIRGAHSIVFPVPARLEDNSLGRQRPVALAILCIW